jgi:hypothetical protein
MKEFTPFQIKCKEELFSVFKSMGVDNFDLRAYESEVKWFAPEVEIVIEIFVGELTAWIYEDGAHINGKEKKQNFRFEKEDYHNEEELMKDFMKKITFLLQQK